MTDLPTLWRDAVKARMAESGETFTSIARTTGMSAPGVHKAVKGNATLATMERIAAALDCELQITLVPARRAKEPSDV